MINSDKLYDALVAKGAKLDDRYRRERDDMRRSLPSYYDVLNFVPDVVSRETLAEYIECLYECAYLKGRRDAIDSISFDVLGDEYK